MGWPVVAAAIGGSLVSGLFSSREASRNRSFQEDMSSTSYQRAVEDLRAAGLNPILAAKVGGASTPYGAMANIPDLGASMSSAMSSSLGWEKVEQEKGLLEAQTKAAEASAEQSASQAGLNQQQTANLKQMSVQIIEQTNLIREQQRSTAASARQADSQTELNYTTAYGKDLDNIVRAMVTKWKQDHPGSTLAQEFGMDAVGLTNILKEIAQGVLQEFTPAKQPRSAGSGGGW